MCGGGENPARRAHLRRLKLGRRAGSAAACAVWPVRNLSRCGELIAGDDLRGSDLCRVDVEDIALAGQGDRQTRRKTSSPCADLVEGIVRAAG